MSLLNQFSDEALLGGGVTATLGFFAVIRRYLPNRRFSRGSARWMNLREAVSASVGGVKAGKGLFKPTDVNGNPGFLLGDWRWSTMPLYYRGESNILTIGSPGAMKGAGVLIPNALGQPFHIIYDLGGEISSVCIEEWRQQGYRVYILNPMGMHTNEPYSFPKHSLNFFDDIDPNMDNFKDDALKMAYDIMGDAPVGDASKFFHERAVSWLQGFIMHTIIASKDEHKNIIRVRDFIQLDRDHLKALAKKMQDSPNKVVRAVGANMILTMGTSATGVSKEFSGVLNTLEVATRMLDSNNVQNAVKTSTVRLKDLKGADRDGQPLKGVIFAIILPQQYKDSHFAVVRLTLGSVLRTMMSGDVARQPVLMTIDEFPSLNKYMSIVKGLSEMRRYKVRINIVAQSISQLKSIYDHDGWGAIESACDVRQYLAAWGYDTAEHISRATGDQTIVETHLDSEHLLARRLIMPDEVMRLPIKEQIVFMANNRPMKLRIRPYWERRSMRSKVLGNPFHGGEIPKANWPLMAVQFLTGICMRWWASLAGPMILVALATIGVMIWAS